MNISVYELTIPQFILSLNSLKRIIQKAEGYAEAKKVEMDVLFNTRLVPDQFPLAKQIQIVCDSAKFCASRLTGVEPPAFEDNEQAVDEFYDRIDKTIAFLKTITEEQFNGFESKTVSFYWNPGMYLDGKSYLIQHAIPNFYFHLATAYSILRASGVDLGKSDYVGKQNWQKG